MPNMINYDEIIDLVKQAGSFAYDENLITSMKGEADFVTQVDLLISSFLKEKLFELYPEIGFFSEEEEGKLSDLCWILDPIDGTTNLVYGYNMSSVSLGLYSDGKIIFGVVYNPFSKECFTAIRGQGAWLNGKKRLQVSNRPMKEAIIEFGAGSTHKDQADANFELAKQIFKQCIDVRRICSSALDLCFIAAGRIDGYFEKVLKPWDIAAGSLILEESGGMISDYLGNPICFEGPTTVIAGNGKTNKPIMETIKACSNKNKKDTL